MAKLEFKVGARFKMNRDVKPYDFFDPNNPTLHIARYMPTYEYNVTEMNKDVAKMFIDTGKAVLVDPARAPFGSSGLEIAATAGKINASVTIGGPPKK